MRDPPIYRNTNTPMDNTLDNAATRTSQVLTQRLRDFGVFPRDDAIYNVGGVAQVLQDHQIINAAEKEQALEEQRVAHVDGVHSRIGDILLASGTVSRQHLITALYANSPMALYSESLAWPLVPYSELYAMNACILAETKPVVYAATTPRRLDWQMPDDAQHSRHVSLNGPTRGQCHFYGPAGAPPVTPEEQRTHELRVVAAIQRYYPGREIKLVPPDANKIAETLRLTYYVTRPGSFAWLLGMAVANGASDIHVIPKLNTYLVFLRRLGVRSQVYEASKSEAMRLLAQVKDHARMDIAERRVPQDGAFNEYVSGRNVAFRAATVPTINGEYVVVRVLDPDSAGRSLEQIGLTEIEAWTKAIGRADGLCLVCGPTGSGKTTTLNASIRQMPRDEESIFSVEDPVEHRIPLVGQVNVNLDAGLTFPVALRAFMRADPDTLVVGEIRDNVTAQLAVSATDTGHRVFATVHAGSIHSAVQRIKHLGIDPKDLRYVLRGVLVQRLMRTVCTHCHGAGCPACMNSGYGDRTLVSECVYLEDEHAVDRLLAEHERWWDTMEDDAHRKAEAGLVSAEDVLHLFGPKSKPLTVDKATRDSAGTSEDVQPEGYARADAERGA